MALVTDATGNEVTCDEVAEVITHLTASDAPLGLLLDSGREALEYGRMFPPSKVQDHPSPIGR